MLHFLTIRIIRYNPTNRRNDHTYGKFSLLKKRVYQTIKKKLMYSFLIRFCTLHFSINVKRGTYLSLLCDSALKTAAS